MGRSCDTRSAICYLVVSVRLLLFSLKEALCSQKSNLPSGNHRQPDKDCALPAALAPPPQQEPGPADPLAKDHEYRVDDSSPDDAPLPQRNERDTVADRAEEDGQEKIVQQRANDPLECRAQSRLLARIPVCKGAAGAPRRTGDGRRYGRCRGESV
jgi:hypothetical protein